MPRGGYTLVGETGNLLKYTVDQMVIRAKEKIEQGRGLGIMD